MAKNKQATSEAGKRISEWVKSQAANKSAAPITSVANEPPPAKLNPKILWGVLAAIGGVAIIGLIAFMIPLSQPTMQTVRGTVMLNGKPISNCKVGFFPELKESEAFNPDRHGFGFALTDSSGNYAIQHPQGEAGIWPGKYKVTFVAWVTNKGDPLPPETKPSEVEGGVINLFPDDYEAPSTTTESVKVEKGIVNVFSFDIKTK